MTKSKEDLIRFANDEIAGRGNLDAVHDVFAADYVVHVGGKEASGRGFVKTFIEQLRAALPDLRVVEIEVLLLAGDTVAWQRTLSGTHRADLKGIPSTGKKVKWRDMIVTRFDGEMIAEEWAVSELAEQLLLKQPRA